MDILRVIKARRTVRRFKNKKVEKDKVEKIVDAARWAPTACNIQGLRLIKIEKKELKQKIVDMGGAIFIKDAPLVFLVVYDNRTENLEYSDYIQSASATIQNMLLAACSLGIYGCWVCQLPNKSQLRRLLKIPSTFDPIAVLVLGYPEKIPKPLPRKHSLNQIVFVDSFIKSKDDLKPQPKAKRFLRKIYYKMPTSVKKATRPIVEKKFVKKFND